MKERILEETKEALDSINVRIYDVTFEKEDGVDTLFIKLDGNVDTDTCAKASELISPIIDKLDLISDEYVLDVCSRGEIDE